MKTVNPITALLTFISRIFYVYILWKCKTVIGFTVFIEVNYEVTVIGFTVFVKLNSRSVFLSLFFECFKAKFIRIQYFNDFILKLNSSEFPKISIVRFLSYFLLFLLLPPSKLLFLVFYAKNGINCRIMLIFFHENTASSIFRVHLLSTSRVLL